MLGGPGKTYDFRKSFLNFFWKLSRRGACHCESLGLFVTMRAWTGFSMISLKAVTCRKLCRAEDLEFKKQHAVVVVGSFAEAPLCVF